jgi:hypothetical protein
MLYTVLRNFHFHPSMNISTMNPLSIDNLQRVQPPSFLQDIEANPTVHPLHRQEERIDPIIEQYVREEAA